MKKLVRVLSTCSIVALGAMVVPSIAGASPGDTVTVQAEAKGHGGKLIARALDQVELRPDQQKEVDKLRSEAAARHQPVKQARRALMVKVADQLDKGQINRCDLGHEVQGVASEVSKVRAADRDAFERLHDILDQDQRKEFVDALKSEVDAARKAHDPGAIADRMGKELNLSSDQKDSIKRIITGLKEVREAQPGYEQHRERWSRTLEAFKGDDFDIDEVAPMGDVEAKATKRINARLWAAEAIIPVLNQQQRSLAAKKLRDRAERMGTQQHQHRETSPSLEPGED